MKKRSAHPARFFREQNLKIVLGDDNPVQTGSLLSNERRVLVSELGFSDEDLRSLDHTSIRAAFVDRSTRSEFISRLDACP
jgi:adenosine deaminase